MTDLQPAKDLVRAFQSAVDDAAIEDIEDVLARYTAPDWLWRGVHPFHEQRGAAAVATAFWQPLREAFSTLQRRPDVFLAGRNDADGGASTWVCTMGHLLGLFDSPWLDVPPTGRLTWLRFAEFHQVEDGCITSSGMFLDVLSVMQQAGRYPLPPEAGVSFMYPGPRTHDGLLHGARDPAEGVETLALVNRMIADLDQLNRSGNDAPTPEYIGRTWHRDILWYGPTGIGATMTIPRYQQQHQYPFRQGLTDKVYRGHVCRIAEGNYCAFFGWPNLTNRAAGGFLGLPGSGTPSEMRVVDVYRREGDRIAENWVLIDLPHWLDGQGLDVLGRMREQLPG